MVAVVQRHVYGPHFAKISDTSAQDTKQSKNLRMALKAVGGAHSPHIYVLYLLINTTLSALSNVLFHNSIVKRLHRTLIRCSGPSDLDATRCALLLDAFITVKPYDWCVSVYLCVNNKYFLFAKKNNKYF